LSVDLSIPDEFDTEGLDDAAVQEPDDGSQATKTVDVKRFNGLQRKLQQVLAENAALKAAASTDEVEPKESTRVPDTMPTELVEQFNAMAAQVAEMQLEKARDKAVEDFPEAKPLKHMLVGATAEEVMDAAKQVAEALKSGATPTEVAEDLKETVEAAPTTTTPAVPVAGGSVEVTEPNLDDLKKEALSHGDTTGWLRLKYKEKGVEI